eukprot:948841_1
MQPLIRLRLLASQLKQHELQRLMDNIVESYIAHEILTFIFNHFVLTYQQTKQHDNDVSLMIQMISNLLNTRKKIKSNTDKVTSATVRIDLLPSDMIGECASFLEDHDYISLSKCNRKTYIGCNSPATLHEFHLVNKYKGCDLNQFPLLKHLVISNPAIKHYVGANAKQNTLANVHSLTLYNQDTYIGGSKKRQ